MLVALGSRFEASHVDEACVRLGFLQEGAKSAPRCARVSNPHSSGAIFGKDLVELPLRRLAITPKEEDPIVVSRSNLIP
jgi:hypothetical protein